MHNDIFSQTNYYKPESTSSASALLTVIDGESPPVEINLNALGLGTIAFGRDERNDIVLRSKFASRFHGCFRFTDGRWVIEDKGSTNGLIFNNKVIRHRTLEDGDFIRIDDGVEATSGGVLLIFSEGIETEWKTFNISNVSEITVGRDEKCDIRLDHISVSRVHAKILAENNSFYLLDNDSTNGVIVNGKQISGRIRLNEKDLILITNSKLIFSSGGISYCCRKNGISVEARQIVKRVGEGKIICNEVNIHIRPCEMVAIVGDSGSGKSTLMNCLNGYSRPTSGNVLVNDMGLHENFDAFKSIIGYVPQSDIVYEQLSTSDMLHYAAQLRLPKDVSGKERAQRIDDVIKTVELTAHKDTLIKHLSGGQRKRASIAVELLSDPNLFFLDEPVSGLDPNTERNMMKTLKSMTEQGKTVVFITHSTLNLHMCDKIAFMGKGGNLCFYGSYDEALEFFGEQDIVDAFNMIYRDPEKWKDLYQSRQKEKPSVYEATATPRRSLKKGLFTQTSVLCKRHFHILFNDRIALALFLFTPPFLALLISAVANGNQYIDYTITKGLLFALTCSAFWIGLSNSIQVVCKERTILKREYMTGLRLGAYILSKITAMTIICAIQSLMLTAVFSLTVRLPSEGVWMPPFFEIMIATFLTALAASATGIFFSTLFKHVAQAIPVVPMLLLPQLLFSGIIFELNEFTEIVSHLAVCRWSMESLGTTANLNKLDALTKDGLPIPGKAIEAFYDFTQGHLASTWIILFGFIAALSLMAWFVLQNIKLEQK